MLNRQVRADLHRLGYRRTRGIRPARIVVIGNVGNGNTGDEALLAVTLATLAPAVEVTVLSRHPEQVTAMHQVPAVAMTPLAAAPVLYRCDGVVVVGGGMFGPGLPPLVRLLPHLLRAATLAGRDVAYVAIGVHQGIPAATLSALRRSTRHSTSVTVRDHDSAHLLDPLHPPMCVGDLGWHLEPAPAREADAALRAAGIDISPPLLLLTPKAGTTPAQTCQLVEASGIAAKHWVSRGGVVAALAFADHTDYGIDPADTDAGLAERISVYSGVRIPCLGPDLHPRLAKAITAEAAAVVGLRFHGVVFATSSGVPATSFAWEPKTAAFLSENHIPALTSPARLGPIAKWLDSAIPLPTNHHTTTVPVEAASTRTTR